MLLRKLFGLSPPLLSQFFQFDGRALVSRFGCSLRVYYITLRQYMNLIFPISLFFTRSFLLLYAFYSASTLPSPPFKQGGLPSRYQLLSYFKMLYHGLEVSPPTSIDFPFGTHSFSYRRIEPLASSVEASLGGQVHIRGLATSTETISKIFAIIN